MPKFLKDRLKAEAAAKGFSGKRAAAYTYGTLNNIGAMHGSAETAKGKAMDVKHAAKAGGSHPHKNLGKYLHPKKG